MKRLLAGTYNSELGGSGNGNPARLRRQLATLTDVNAHAWAFQECSGWRDDRTRTLGTVEDALQMRGFVARSNRGPGGDVAVFIREASGIRLAEQRHEEQPQPYRHAVAHVVTRTAEALAEYLTDAGDYLGVRTPPSVTGAARCLAGVTGSAPPRRRTRSPASRSSRWPTRNRDHRPAVAAFTLTT